MTDENSRWEDRVLCVLGTPEAEGIDVDTRVLLALVAARYAYQFDSEDRIYVDGEPRWHIEIRVAFERLEATGLVRTVPSIKLTAAGQERMRSACERVDGVERAQPESLPTEPPLLPPPGVIAPPLRSEVQPASSEEPRPRVASVMVELNLRYRTGPERAFERLCELWRLVGGGEPFRVSDHFVTGELTMQQIEGLEAADSAVVEWPGRCIFRIWPDFEVQPQIDVSAVTIKAEAARRSFNCCGDDIVWGVVDSGIDAQHPHFRGYRTLDHDSVAGLHRTFTGVSEPTPEGALIDEMGHGTHVAGIIAGGLEAWDDPQRQVLVTEERYNMADPDRPIVKPREVGEIRKLAGMAPHTKLVSLKVLGGTGTATARVGRVVQALAYVRSVNATSDLMPRIHGVNLSLGYEFDAEWFACGRSPLCMEVDKLVRSGVVVVVAAGNSGHVKINPTFDSPRQFSMGMTINDPGNAARAVTVGSTHRDCPHTYGVSYFSSRGPTGDGRSKPDLVAPGERIASAAAGRMLEPVVLTRDQENAAVYVESSGTSMAAPHVSGAVAAFLSVRREFIGNPEEVKRVFVESATPLGRDPNFQGGGLVDLMRAMQAV